MRLKLEDSVRLSTPQKLALPPKSDSCDFRKVLQIGALHPSPRKIGPCPPPHVSESCVRADIGAVCDRDG